MAVTILERPEGNILDPASLVNNFTIVNGGVDDAYFVSGGHGLSTGDIIYVQTNVEDYNGFLKIEVDGAGSFYIHPLDGNTADSTDRIAFISAISTGIREYYVSSLTHGWSAVHLPITYRLSSDLYPTNSVDTTRNINSVQDANGYTVLQLSGSLGTVHTYDFIKLTLPSDTDLSAVYQILEFISPTVILINLEYDTANNFTGATALKHYNNYNIIVRVYAGINTSHTWTAQKPYELAATLLFIPDDNNEAFFSINELLKSYIETRNNLILGTLPNNIDFWANFYIEIAESYDDSDGYVFGTTTSAFVSDQAEFEGVAVNAKLDFKNIYSGYLSAYLMTNNTAKFLTMFTIPVLFSCGTNTPDCYHDISFLSPYDGFQLVFREKYYLNGNLGTTNDISLGTPDKGVIRATMSEADCDYDRVDVEVMVKTDDFTDNLSLFVAGVATETYDVFILEGADPTTVFKYNADITIVSGVTAGDSVSYLIQYVHEDGTFTTVDSGTRTTVGSTTFTNVSFPIPTKNVIGVKVTLTIVDAPATGLDASAVVSVTLSTDLQYTISETKEFKIDCGCSTQEIRLTWLNNLGGFDYWAFTAKADDIVEIQEAMTTKKNILPTWPKSYGADADTIKKQTLRVSNKAYTVRSQFLTEDQLNAISFLESSILVQIINSRNDRRTVLVGTDSFIKRKDGDKTHEIAFNVSFTDDIAVQTT